MKTYGGMDLQVHVDSFTPRQLYPWEKKPGTHRIGGWVDPTAGMDDMK
jgi:hypothetical protein